MHAHICVNIHVHVYTYKIKLKVRTGELDTTQQLRMLAVLAEDPDPITKLQSRGFHTLFWALLGATHAHATQIQI